MSNLSKKIMSIILALTLILSYIPIGSVFAQTPIESAQEDVLTEEEASAEEGLEEEQYLGSSEGEDILNIGDGNNSLFSIGHSEFDASDNYLHYNEVVIKDGERTIGRDETLIVGKTYNVSLTLSHSAKTYTIKNLEFEVSFNDADPQSIQIGKEMGPGSEQKSGFSFSPQNEGENTIFMVLRGKYNSLVYPGTYSKIYTIKYDARYNSNEKFNPKGKDCTITVNQQIPEPADFVVCEKEGYRDAVKECKFVDPTPSGSQVGSYPVKVEVTYNDNTSDLVEATLVVENKKYTVTFKDGDDVFVEQQVEEGKMATKPGDPTKDGRRFLDWYIEGETEPFDFSTEITKDLTLYAQWENVFNVRYYFATEPIENDLEFNPNPDGFWPGAGQGFAGKVFTKESSPLIGDDKGVHGHYPVDESLAFSVDGQDGTFNKDDVSVLSNFLKSEERTVTFKDGRTLNTKTDDFYLRLFRIVNRGGIYHVDVEIKLKANDWNVEHLKLPFGAVSEESYPERITSKDSNNPIVEHKLIEKSTWNVLNGSRTTRTGIPGTYYENFAVKFQKDDGMDKNVNLKITVEKEIKPNFRILPFDEDFPTDAEDLLKNLDSYETLKNVSFETENGKHKLYSFDEEGYRFVKVIFEYEGGNKTEHYAKVKYDEPAEVQENDIRTKDLVVMVGEAAPEAKDFVTNLDEIGNPAVSYSLGWKASTDQAGVFVLNIILKYSDTKYYRKDVNLIVKGVVETREITKNVGEFVPAAKDFVTNLTDIGNPEVQFVGAEPSTDNAGTFNHKINVYYTTENGEKYGKEYEVKLNVLDKTVDNTGGGDNDDNTGGDNDNNTGDSNTNTDTTGGEEVDLEDEETPLGTGETGDKDKGDDTETTTEVVNLEDEETPLGTVETGDKDKGDDTETTTEVVNLEDEETPLGTGTVDPNGEKGTGEEVSQVIEIEEEAVALGTGSLPYTAQAPYNYFIALGGVFVSLGLLLRRAVRK